MQRKKRRKPERHIVRRFMKRLRGQFRGHSSYGRRRRRWYVTASPFSVAAMRCVQAVLLLILVVSLFQVSHIVIRSCKTRSQNEALALLHEQYDSGADSTPLPDSMASPSPQLTPTPTAAQPLSIQNAPESTTAVQVVRSTKYHQVGGEPLPEMEVLHEENHDLVAWIEIPQVLSLPVVYKDNQYYVSHDFYKNKNESGAIFLDENHAFRENAQNLLLHGHNMKDGTMFGHLVRYATDSNYIKEHALINFNTLWRKEQYVIFSVLDVSLDINSEDFVNYFSHNTFFSDLQFETYVRQLQLKSIYAIPIDIKPSDALLTLSTCFDDNRLVIVARRVREDESKRDLRERVRLAVRQ